LIVANSSDRLRVVVATPLAEEHCKLIEQLEPRIELVRDQSLYPPMRHPADFSGDPSFRRTPSQQHAFEAMLDSAEALYGIPDVDPAALSRMSWSARTRRRSAWPRTGSSRSCSLPMRPVCSMETN
jgi:hypothetical protein